MPGQLLATSLKPIVLQTVILGLGFVSGALLARSLGVSGRGEFQLSALAYGLTGPVFGLGLGSMLSAANRSIWPELRQHLALLVVQWMAVALTINLLPMDGTTKAVLIAGIWATLLSPLTEAYYFRRLNSKRVQLLRAIDVGGTSLSIGVLAAFSALSVGTATAALLAPTIVLRTAIAIIAVRSRANEPQKAASNISDALATSVRRFWPWDIAVGVSAGADMIVAALLLSHEQLGLYAVAVSIGRLALTPFSAVAPHLTSSAGAAISWNRAWRNWLAVPISLAVAGSTIFVLWGGQLVAIIYGDQFLQSTSAAGILLVSSSLLGCAAATESYMVGDSQRSISILPRVAGSIALAVMAAGIGFQAQHTPMTVALSMLGSSIVVVVLTVLGQRGRTEK